MQPAAFPICALLQSMHACAQKRAMHLSAAEVRAVGGRESWEGQAAASPPNSASGVVGALALHHMKGRREGEVPLTLGLGILMPACRASSRHTSSTHFRQHSRRKLTSGGPSGRAPRSIEGYRTAHTRRGVVSDYAAAA